MFKIDIPFQVSTFFVPVHHLNVPVLMSECSTRRHESTTNERISPSVHPPTLHKSTKRLRHHGNDRLVIAVMFNPQCTVNIARNKLFRKMTSYLPCPPLLLHLQIHVPHAIWIRLIQDLRCIEDVIEGFLTLIRQTNALQAQLSDTVGLRKAVTTLENSTTALVCRKDQNYIPPIHIPLR